MTIQHKISGATFLSGAVAAMMLSCRTAPGQDAPGTSEAARTTSSTLIPELRPYHGEIRKDVDATTLRARVMCGYQGWFRAVGDGVANQWHHWSLDPNEVRPETLTVEMWPDMTDYPTGDRFFASGLKNADGGGPGT